MAAPAESSCSALVPQLAPFMQQPAPAANIVELLAPAWWLMDGKPLGQFPLREFWPVLLGYVRSNPVPVACVGALCALVLLSLLLFVTWRFVRCVKVVCCQQESYGDANKVLFSRRLKSGKALLVVLGLLACGAAAWGMISLNRDILPSLNARIDSMQEFPARIVKQVTGLARETAQLSQPLHNISSIIHAADLDGLRSDLTAVTAFLADAPSPGTLRATLQQLSSALKPQLFDALRQLHGKLNVASPTSPLAVLKGYLDVLSDFDIAPMAPAIRSYSDSTKALFEVITSDWTNTEVQASREFAKLRSSYDQVDLDAWVPYIDQAVATANAINSMRTPATNPFTLVLKSLGEVTAAVNTIRGQHLASITGTVKQFNGLWHNNASRAFESLLDRAAHINHTVLELPRDVESKVRLVNASLADFDKLYAGKDGLLALPNQITAAGAKLAMPDTSGFTTQLKAAEAALTDAPGLDELISKLGALAYALDQTLRDAKNSIEPSLDAFARDPSTRLDLQDTLTFEGPVLARAADAFEHAGVPAFKDVLRSVGKSLESVLVPAKREADAIPGVLHQVSEFDVISTYLPTLQQAEHVYAQFGGNPANLTKPVFEMLDRVSDILHRELVDAQLLVNNVSSSVLKMSDNIHAAAVDSIDRFQSTFLGVPTNSSSATTAAAASASAQASTRAAGTLQKAVDGAYYATLGLYALVIALLLLLFVTTLLNCPAGVCAAGFLLNTALVAFAVLPLVLTLGMLVMRDTCGSMEAIANKAVITKAGNGSIPAALSNFYLGGGGGTEGGAGSFPELMRDINEDYDVAEIKERMQQTVNDMLHSVTKDYKLRPLMTQVFDDATARITSLMGSMDAVLLSLDHDSVVGVYQQGKSFFCCGLVKQAYVQWAASLMVLALAWVALQCALSVLQRLDTLSESCCRFRRYRSGDYGSEPGRRPILGLPPHKPLQATDSAGSETVAVISLGGALMGKPKVEQAGDGGELPKSTPLPGPLSVSSAPPAAQRMTQRRLYAVPPASQGSSDGGSSSSSAQLEQSAQPHQLQRLRVATPRSPLQSGLSTLYPAVTPAVVPSSPTCEQWQATPTGMPGRGLVRSPAGRI